MHVLEFSAEIFRFSGRTMSKIKIVYKQVTYPVKIDDVSPTDLQECFSLKIAPKFLYDEKADENIYFKYWKEELKTGSRYHLKGRGIDEEESQKVSINDSFVLHSLIASSAVYMMEHKDVDEMLVRQYLYDQIENHCFEYIIQSKNGENVYLIAKEKEANRIYVAFRGTKDLLDWKYNLQVHFVLFIFPSTSLFFFLQKKSFLLPFI